MKHPEPIEWLAYLEGEASPETARQFAEHLEACPQCAAEVAAWQGSIQKLHDWNWPRVQRDRSFAMPAWVKWGIAAVLVLGLGFSLGRSNTPNLGEFKATLAAQVRAQLRQELETDLMAAIAQDDRSLSDEFQRRLRSQLGAALARTVTVSTGEKQRLAQEIRALVKDRDEDRLTMLALFDRIQKLQEEAYLALRKDLENLASTADDRLQQTRWQLTRLAANTHPLSDKP